VDGFSIQVTRATTGHSKPPSLKKREFDRYWAMAHVRIGRDLPKAGRRKGKAKTARLDQKGNPIE
jgi:hypothetical protein